MLSAWLSSSAQPVLAVIGIGGMGKSALTWAWLQRDVLGLPLPGASPDSPADATACRLPDDARPEGVLWWSFYETQASFVSFLDEAIGYASDGAINPRDIPYMALGELAAAERNQRRSIELCREIGSEFWEAAGHRELGRLLNHQGMFEEAEVEFELAPASLSKLNRSQSEGLVWAYRAVRALFMQDPHAALEAAQKARELANAWRHERDVIQAEWLLGAVLLAQAAGNDHNKSLIEAESHLTEALTRCRRINMVDHEPDILLAWARWHQLQGNSAQARADADEALTTSTGWRRPTSTTSWRGWRWMPATAPLPAATPRSPGSARGAMGRCTAISRRSMRPSGCWERLGRE